MLKIRNGLILFFVAFGVYLFTMHPGISPYRDSGDLITAASTLGIAHPPGYPLYSMLGKVFCEVIPFGNTAFKLNLMSAFFGAGTVFFLALVIPGLIDASFFAVLALLLFAFSTSQWRLSQVSEMYSLNAFFAALIIFISYKIYWQVQDPNLKGEEAKRVLDAGQLEKKKLLLVLGLVCGLAVTNHPTIVFIFPSVLYILWHADIKSSSWYIKALGFFIFGLAVYMFLPFRAMSGPVSSWGDSSSLSGIFRIITRADYGGLKLHPEQSKFEWSALMLYGHLKLYTLSLAEQFTWPGLAAGVYGIYVKRKSRFFKGLLAAFLLSGIFFVIISNLPVNEKTTLPILEPHLILPNLIFIIFIAAGLFAVRINYLRNILIAAVVIYSFVVHINACNYRRHFYAYDYGKNLLATYPKNTIVFNPDDSTAFILTYFQDVMGLRKDLKLAAYYRTRWGYERIKRLYPEILPAWEITSGQELERTVLDFNREKLPVFSELPQKFPGGYVTYPFGIGYKLSVKNEFEPDNSPFIFYRGRISLKSLKNDFFADQIISYYSSAHSNLGLAYANKGVPDIARTEYYKALAIDPELSAAYNNFGILEYNLKNFGEAEKWFKVLLEKEPKNSSFMYNLGLNYRAWGKIDLAKEYFGKSWLNGYYANSGNELGLYYLNRKEFIKAVGYFHTVLDHNPDFILAYYNLGAALYNLEEYEESRKNYELYYDKVNDPAEKEEVLKILKAFKK